MMQTITKFALPPDAACISRGSKNKFQGKSWGNTAYWMEDPLSNSLKGSCLWYDLDPVLGPPVFYSG